MREGSGGFMPNLPRDDFAAGFGAVQATGSGEETALRSAAVYATLCSVTRSPVCQGAKMDHRLPELGDLEREVMQLVWAQGPVTAEAVREQLARRLKESTVRTVLRRLEEKGYVAHTVDGRTYVYQATQPRGRVAAKAVQRIVDWF